LEKRLEQAGKHAELEQIRKIAELANFYYLRQRGPLGNATPILNAKDIVGDEPFLVLWGDDFIEATPTRSQQLVSAYERLGGSAILGSIRTTKPEDYNRYAFAQGKEVAPGVLKIEKIAEKPGKLDSDYAIVSGCLYGPEMFGAIEEAKHRLEKEGGNRELVYVDAVNVLLEQGKDCYAVEIKDAHYYDTGNKLEYLKAVVEFGLKHEDLHTEFADFLKNLKV
jgi:UTP--glucose-1-phosphate uridylyltransferase